MTVRLLSDRPPYRAGNIVTYDAATETGLVSAKEASTDLTGGTTPAAAAPASVLAMEISRTAVWPAVTGNVSGAAV